MPSSKIIYWFSVNWRIPSRILDSRKLTSSSVAYCLKSIFSLVIDPKRTWRHSIDASHTFAIGAVHRTTHVLAILGTNWHKQQSEHRVDLYEFSNHLADQITPQTNLGNPTGTLTKNMLERLKIKCPRNVMRRTKWD